MCSLYYYYHKSYLPLACPDNEPQWSATLHISITGCPWYHYTVIGFSPLRLAFTPSPSTWLEPITFPVPFLVPDTATSSLHLLYPFSSPGHHCICHALNAITTFPNDRVLKLLCVLISARFQSSFSSPSLNKSSLSNEVPTVVVSNVALSLFQPDLVSCPRLWPLDPQLAESLLESSVPSTVLFAPLLVYGHSDVSRGRGKQKGY